MDTLEFRVWNKKMIYFTFKDVQGVGSIAHVSNEQGLACVECKDGDHHIMFFSGLRDKNNKKIFDKDIVNFKNYGVATIEFDDGKFMVTSVLDKGEYLADVCDAEVEVIGNIYENPELLGGMK